MSIICWHSGPYLTAELAISNPLELKTLNCISAVLIDIDRIALRVVSSIFYLISIPSKLVFLTNASFQYGLSSSLPGSSNKLTLFLQSLSMANLKRGWVDKG